MTTLALIGAGKWGQNYLRTATTLKNIKIKYVCTKSRQTLNSLPNTYIKTLSLKALLKNKDIDGFVIATPSATHFTIAKQLLSLGHNLLIEKPLTTNLTEALKLQQIWKIKKPKVLVGHIYLYNPAYRVFKKKFEHLANVKSISFTGLQSPAREDISVIWDWGPHPVAIALNLVKQPVEKVQATGITSHPANKLYDTLNALIWFTNGIKTSIRVSWHGQSKVRLLTAEGENGRIKLGDTNLKQSVLAKELVEFTNAIQGNEEITSDIHLGVAVVEILAAIEQSVKNKGKLIKLV